MKTFRCLTLLVMIFLSSATLYAQSMELVRANNSFAFDLYKECSFKAGASNVFFSPFSISSALAMTYVGARGLTAAEMKTAMNFLNKPEKQNEEYRLLLGDIRQPHSPFIVSNTLWTHTGTPFEEDFIQTNASSFGATPQPVDFFDQENAVKQINETIAKQTNGKIRDLMPNGSVSGDTRLVLTNAVYFKDGWMQPFEKEFTREGDFKSTPEKSVKAMFMFQTGYFKSFDNDVVSILELPFENTAYSLLILLPKINIDEFESEHLEADTYPTWEFESKKFTKILVPRFRIEQETDVVPILKKFGMNKAFREGEADFSGITKTQQLAIKGIYHKAFVEINEEGAEAAAATGVVAEQRSLQAPREFIANHPFIFIIRENHSESILFIGKLVNP